MRYTVWTAKPEDIETVMTLLYQRVEWLREKGSEQWSTYQRWRPEMVASIQEYRTFLLREADSEEALGTITLSTDGDPDFWTPEERETPALYLAKLATRPAKAGQGLGRLLLDYALHEAIAQRLAEVRMDVWKSSTELHDYYRAQGWTYLRTVECPGRFSGTLFSRVVKVPAVNWPPRGLEVRPPGPPMAPSDVPDHYEPFSQRRFS